MADFPSKLAEEALKILSDLDKKYYAKIKNNLETCYMSCTAKKLQKIESYFGCVGSCRFKKAKELDYAETCIGALKDAQYSCLNYCGKLMDQCQMHGTGSQREKRCCLQIYNKCTEQCAAIFIENMGRVADHLISRVNNDI